MLNEVKSEIERGPEKQLPDHAGPAQSSPARSTQTATVSLAPEASTLSHVAAFLAGRKTYLIAGAALLYLLGCKLGWWAFDGEILAAFGFTGAASLRAAVAKVIASQVAPVSAVLPQTQPASTEATK